MKLARRMSDIGTESAFEVVSRAMALQAEGRDIVHLQIGEPDFDTPGNVRAAAKRAIDEGYTHYGPPLGMPELRAAIAADMTARKGFPVQAGNVIVVPGSKPILFYAMLALAEEGDEVVYPDPGYPIYESMARYAGARARPYGLRAVDDFRVELDELAGLVNDRTKVLVLNSPHNPTGGVLTRDDMAGIAALVEAHPQLVILTDEIYGRIVYDDSKHVSLASFGDLAERTIVMDGFSKTFAMTGWRLGYAYVPDPLLDAYTSLIINSVSCTPLFSQIGAVEALTGPQDEIEAMRTEFDARRRFVVERLNAIDGIGCHLPHGAFYAFPDVSGTGLTGGEFAERLLMETGVCLLAGTAFGEVGRDHVRISYANSHAELARGLDRMADWVASLPEPVASATA
jgi:aspartate/methionine/tyrosine aminotransferase